MMKLTKSLALVGFVAVFCASASAQINVRFSERNEKRVLGREDSTEIWFSSALREPDAAIAVRILVNGRVFAALFPLQDRGRVEASDLSTGEPARLERADVVKLRTLYIALKDQLDYGRDVERRLSRFLAYLWDFHPVRGYFDNGPGGEDTGAAGPSAITPICDSIGQTLEARYDIEADELLLGWRCGPDADVSFQIGRILCSELAVAGPFDAEPCLGRCGPGCNPFFSLNDNVFSQECFNHDVCVGGTGDNAFPIPRLAELQPCTNEFRAAANSFLFGDDCAVASP